MSDIYFKASDHNFKVVETESGSFIYSGPIKTFGMYEKHPELQLQLSKNVNKEKAWEIAYLLNEFAISFKLIDVTSDNIIE